MTPDELPRWVRWVLYADTRVLVAFVRPVWWIDYRFHFNNYRQALVVMLFAATVHLTGFAMMLATKMPLISKAAFLLASVAYGNMALGWCRKLVKASAAYERNPWAMTFERVFFYWQPIPPLRLMMLAFGLHICGLMCAIAGLAPFNAMRDVGAVLFNSWVLIGAVGLYIAAVPPSNRPRREKKALQLFMPPMRSSPI